MALLSVAAAGAAELRPPVHPRRNVDEFEPVPARWVRFTILKTNGSEPCLDELEIFTAGSPPENVALAGAGARTTVSGTMAGYAIHRQEHLNDGLYGNARSWIADTVGAGWVVVELPRVEFVRRVVWGRDREGRFLDRLPTAYRIEVATEPDVWKTVASSDDRRPLEVGGTLAGANPSHRFAINRFAPVETTLAPAVPSGPPAEYAIRVWQIEDGLPANTITALLPSREGYLWLGTYNGLARFDGARFVAFGEADGLANPHISCLWEDGEGVLWAGTEGGGLVRWDGREFSTFTVADGLSDNFILALAGDASGRLWVGTRSGLDRLDPGGGIHRRVVPALGSAAVSRLVPHRGGDLWAFAGGFGLLHDGRWLPPPFEGEPAAFTSLTALHEGPSGALWIGGANGYVARLHDGVASVMGRDEGFHPDLVTELCETRSGDLWVGTVSGGLSRLRDGRFLTLTTQDGLPHNSIRALAEDAEGSLWAGTQGGGLLRLRPRPFTTHTTAHGLSHNVVMSFAEGPEGQVWIGSNCGGLNVWQDGRVTGYAAHFLLDNECIWPLLTGCGGRLWIGSWGGGLFELNEGRLKNHLVADGLSDDILLALAEDAEGALWIGTFAGGLNRLLDGRFTVFRRADGLASDTVTALLPESSGVLWIGTGGGGLQRFDGGRFTGWRRTDGLASDFVRTLHQDAQGRLWVGTAGGLSLIMNGRCHTFTPEHGLMDPVISQILEDGKGHLWLGSQQGISRVGIDDLLAVAAGRAPAVTPISFGREEGMESAECTGGFHPAGLRTRDGTLWFSTVKGFVRMDPDEVRVNRIAPPVRIEDVLVDGHPEGTAGMSLRLPVRTRRLEIRYTALSLAAPSKVRFRYRLEGLEEDWVDAGGRRSAVYTHLPAGQFRFQVLASNNDGVWNLEGAMLPVSVLPPFWQTWWFLGVATVAGLGLSAGGVRLVALRKLRARLRHLEAQHALERERTRIARDIHDDLGAGLTQIALLSALGERHSGDPAESAGHFRQIGTRARAIVQSADAIVWAVNPTNDSLDHLADYLAQHARDFLGAAGIRCRIEFPDTFPGVALTAEVRHALFLATKEALHNVVKHARATEVWLRLSVDADRLSLVVEDDGCGLPAGFGDGAAGNGIGNLRRRLGELGGAAAFEQRQGGGAKVRLTVPLRPVRVADRIQPS
ncbi:MAG: histidine kinase [Verrucomicrobiae bacterium]|nr:histidine kinase [Verrucomicrobiae bacterium]